MVRWVSFPYSLFANLWGYTDCHDIQRPGLLSTSLQAHWSRSILNWESGWILKSTQNDKILKTEWKAGKDYNLPARPTMEYHASICKDNQSTGAVPLPFSWDTARKEVHGEKKQKEKLQEVVNLTSAAYFSPRLPWSALKEMESSST